MKNKRQRSKLAELIATERERKDLSQDELGQLSEVGRDYISAIETDRNKHPQADKLAKIAKALGIPKDDVLKAAGYVALIGEIPTSEKVILTAPSINTKMERYIQGIHKVVDELVATLPIVSVPVYTKFPHSQNLEENPVDMVYVPRPANPEYKLEGYVVKFAKESLSPPPYESVVIVDWNAVVSNGDFVICRKGEDIIFCGYSEFPS